MEQPACSCGRALTADEILYYETTCEKCEEAFTVSMQNDAMNECSTDGGCSGTADSDINDGVWFKSSLTGALYRNHRATGDIDCILVDGVWYDRSDGQ